MKRNKNAHPHLNPLPEGEESSYFPPFQGEGQGGDGSLMSFRITKIMLCVVLVF